MSTSNPRPLPLMSQPRVQRVVYPLLVAIVLLGAWQGLVTGLELPPYLVPSPVLMMETLFTDWMALGGALLAWLQASRASAPVLQRLAWLRPGVLCLDATW